MFGRAAAVRTFLGSDEGTCRLRVVGGHDRCFSRIGLFGEPSLHDHDAFGNGLLRGSKQALVEPDGMCTGGGVDVAVSRCPLHLLMPEFLDSEPE